MASFATKLLLPFAIGTNNAWLLEGAANKLAAVQTSDDATGYIRSNSSNLRQAFKIDTTFPEKMAFIESVKIKGRCASDSGTAVSNRFRVYINGVSTDGALFSATTTWADFDSGALARPGGGDWTEDDLRLSGANALEIEIFHPSQTPQTYCTYMYLEVTYVPLEREIEAPREVGSRALLEKRDPQHTVEVETNWQGFEAELLDPVAITHPLAPTADGQGWGTKPWQRGDTVLRKQVISMGAGRRSIRSTHDVTRRFQTPYWEAFKLVKSGDPDVADGMPRLDRAGAARQFERNSKAWTVDVGGLVVLRTEAKEKFEKAGQLIENEATNYVRQSSFVNGVTGWTKVENTGTGLLETTTQNPLFDTGVSTQGVKITATAATHDVEAQGVVESLAASLVHTLSVDIGGDGGFDQFVIGLRNDATGDYLYRDGSWNPTKPSVLNSPIAGAAATELRLHFTFTTQGTASTHTAYIAGVGSSNGTVYRFYHVQVERGPYPTSRIVTEAAAVSRSADNLRIRNDSSLSSRIVPVDRFTLMMRFTPLWNSSDLTTRRVLWELLHDADNQMRLQYTAAGNLEFVFEHGGVTDFASFPSLALTESVEYELVCRKTGTDQELGASAHTLSVFANGVKGSTQDVAGAMTQAASSYLQLGALSDATEQCDGHIGEIFISPFVLTDQEIAGGF